MRRLLTMVTMVTAASSALLTGASAAAAGGLAAGGSGAFGRSAAAAGGAWGKAREIPGTAAISTTHPILDAVVDSVSCASAGNCGAGGTYEDRFGNRFAFVVSQVNDAWGKAQKVRGTIILKNGNFAEVSSVSCASAGNCGAGGFYRDSAGIDQAWVVSEKNGTWGKAEEVPGTAALNVARGNGGVNSVSCASAGNCSAGGVYTNAARQDQAFVVSEKNGTWGKAEQVPGLVSSDAGVDSVSCVSAGNCSAGGFGGHQTSRSDGVFVVSQKNGIWGHAQNIGGLGNTGASIASVSCGSAGNCGAGGFGGIAGEAFIAGERNGIVGAAQAVPGLATLGGGGAITSMSCASAGDCTAGGYYVGTGIQAFVVSEKNGTWGRAEEIPGTAALNRGGNAEVNSVSCGSAGNCSVGGVYSTINMHDQAFVVSEKNGVWGKAEQVPGTAVLNKGKSAQVNSVSCASAGNCSVGGYYHSRKFDACLGAFVVSEKNGRWGKAEQVPGTVLQPGCAPVSTTVAS
jgi:hypothetical protein